MIEKIIASFKKNIKSILIFTILFLILTFELPYVIEKPGGIIDISKKITFDDDFKITGSLNMAYVSSITATLPTFITAKINSSWDIIKKENNKAPNESDKDALFRGKMALEESINNAIISAYKKANKQVKINSEKIYVTYIFEQANTNLEVGDQIISIDGIKISSKDVLNNYISNLNQNQKVKIKVMNNGKIKEKQAKIIQINDMKLIGILLGEKIEFETNPDINIVFTNKESGSSGGLMMALSIYQALSKTDLTHGLKIVGTGTINKEGKVGEISGIKYKLAGAVNNKADIFLVPDGENYKEAIKEKKKHNYKIEIVKVTSLDQVIDYLKHR